MEIIDTVYLVAFLIDSDPLHDKAVQFIESLSPTRKISQASLLELDLLMKARGFNWKERLRTWLLLSSLIPKDFKEVILPFDLSLAAFIVYKYELDYFDAIISAQCILRNAKPLTTDREILQMISKSFEVLEEFKQYQDSLIGKLIVL